MTGAGGGRRDLPRLPVGRVVMSVVAVVTGAGAYLADWNETHIYNPTWPPHAKFHNGQTMSMGAALAAATLVQLWRPTRNPAQARTALDGAAMTASLYWVTQVSALAYPGAKAFDPPSTRGSFPAAFLGVLPLAALALGYAVERRQLR